ncbi:MAG: hypothetical protein GF331_24640, partial [Chitinivibrionales bacterium]|nr:hypothetical protein [Chitinivibrionales bacterium]
MSVLQRTATSIANFPRTLWVGVSTAFIEMGKHKLRSFLSILGVMLGVAALVAMLSLIGGIEEFLEEKMGRWTGAMFIHRERDMPEKDFIAWSRSPGLRLSDGIHLDNESEDVDEVYHRIDRRETVTISGERVWRVRTRGLSFESFAADSNIVTVGKGRMFTDREFAAGEKVCLVSWGVAEHLGRQWMTSDLDTADLVG